MFPLQISSFPHFSCFWTSLPLFPHAARFELQDSLSLFPLLPIQAVNCQVFGFFIHIFSEVCLSLCRPLFIYYSYLSCLPLPSLLQSVCFNLMHIHTGYSPQRPASSSLESCSDDSLCPGTVRTLHCDVFDAQLSVLTCQ